MRIIFFGTPEIAVPSLERLIAGPSEVVGIVSQPDRGRGRGRRVSPSPVSQVALAASLPLFRPQKVADVESELRALDSDIGVVVAFGQFIPKKIRELPLLGFSINAHASLLPKFRGAAPINHAILSGEERTGISVMRVVREMDAGPVALTREIEIGPTTNAAELTEQLANLAPHALEEAIAQIEAGSVIWTEQDAMLASEAPKLDKQMGMLDWSESAIALARRVRAFAPKPGAFTHCGGAVLRILSAEPVGTESIGGGPATPGTTRCPNGKSLFVATRDGWLSLLRVQRAGGKELPIDAYLRGHPNTAESQLGDPTAPRDRETNAGSAHD
jgi:methionyl-tRNA formyltransferase